MARFPSPVSHPNAYAGFSSAAVASFLVTEAKRRLGFDLSYQEAGYIVSGVVACVLFFGHRAKQK